MVLDHISAPGAMSPCPSDVAAGLASRSSQPCPTHGQSGGMGPAAGLGPAGLGLLPGSEGAAGLHCTGALLQIILRGYFLPALLSMQTKDNRTKTKLTGLLYTFHNAFCKKE